MPRWPLLGTYRQRDNMFRIQRRVVRAFKLGAIYCGKPRRRATRHNQMGAIRVALNEHIHSNPSPVVTLQLRSIDYCIVLLLIWPSMSSSPRLLHRAKTRTGSYTSMSTPPECLSAGSRSIDSAIKCLAVRHYKPLSRQHWYRKRGINSGGLNFIFTEALLEAPSPYPYPPSNSRTTF